MCRTWIESETGLQQHLRHCVNSGRKVTVLLQRLTDEQMLACHAPNHAPQPQLEESTLHHECQLCGEHLRSAGLLKSHIDLHLTEFPCRFKCTFSNCAILFSSSCELKKHRWMHYQALKRIVCDVCGKVSDRKSELKRHMQRHIQLRPYACNVPCCLYSARFSYELKQHQKRAHTSILSKCGVCGVNFKSDVKCKIHVVKHKSEKLGVLKCVYKKCAALWFNQLTYLRDHVDNVHPVTNKYISGDSGCNFERSDSLVKIHKTQRSWDRRHYRYTNACQSPGCSSSFLLPEQLLEHMQSNHANSKESKCMLCGKIVLQHALFWQHVTKHQTDMMGVVKCAYSTCNQTFTTTIDLKEHVKHFHQFQLSASSSSELRGTEAACKLEKPRLYHCQYPDCPYAFKFAENLHAHLRSSGNHEHLPSVCMLCGMVMKERRQFWPHVKEHQTDVAGVFKCAFSNCILTFDSVVDLKDHIKICHAEPSAGIDILLQVSIKGLLMCDVCSHYISSKKQLKLHILKHLKSAPPDPKLHSSTRMAISNDDTSTNVELEEEEIKIEEVVFD